VTGLEQLKAWGAMMQLVHLGDGPAMLTRLEVGPHFDSILEGLKIAGDHGLTCIQEIPMEDDGFETAVIFKQVRTEKGNAFVGGPAPTYKPTRSEERELEMQLQRDAARIRARING